MNNNSKTSNSRVILAISAILTVVGTVSLVAAVIIGFEELNGKFVGVALGLALACPAAILVHLWLTTEVTPHEKRLWLREFIGSRAPRAFSAYSRGQRRRVNTSTDRVD
jgi:hypothetical protein